MSIKDNCPYCNKQFKLSSLKQHIREKHYDIAVADGKIKPQKYTRQKKEVDNKLVEELIYDEFSKSGSNENNEQFSQCLVLKVSDDSSLSSEYERHRDIHNIDKSIQHSSTALNNIISSLNFMCQTATEEREVKASVVNTLRNMRLHNPNQYQQVFDEINALNTKIDVSKKIWSSSYEFNSNCLSILPATCFTEVHAALSDRLESLTDIQLDAELLYLEALYMKAVSLRISRHKSSMFISLIKDCLLEPPEPPLLGLNNDGLLMSDDEI